LDINVRPSKLKQLRQEIDSNYIKIEELFDNLFQNLNELDEQAKYKLWRQNIERGLKPDLVEDDYESDEEILARRQQRNIKLTKNLFKLMRYNMPEFLLTYKDSYAIL
jgi:hypothetical protein